MAAAAVVGAPAGTISEISTAKVEPAMGQASSSPASVKRKDKKKTPPVDAVSPAPPAAEGDMLSAKDKKIGHRRVNENTGEVTYKKKTTSDLMKAIQLGIGQSVGLLTQKPERDVLMQDFSVVETVAFPEDGSKITPAHRVGDYRFKTYAPIAFRYFRELFNIQPDDFLASICTESLQELSNPGASGSVFFISEDDEFIIKTLQHKEAHFLQKLLPGYYMNLNQNPRTLLPKFYGLYCHMQSGKNIRLAIMNNLLPSSVRMHEKFDLKGSTYKRKASKHELAKRSPTLKDLDFMDRHPDGIFLEQETFDALLKTIKVDCRVLESFKIMDYSFLLGIHNLDISRRDRDYMTGVSMANEDTSAGHQTAQTPSSATHGVNSNNDRGTSGGADTSSSGISHSGISGAAAGFSGASGSELEADIGGRGAEGGLTRSRSVKQRLATYSTAMESIQADAEPVNLEDEDVPPGGIPARNSRGERLLLYVGIIDILQNYRFKKKLEHSFKSIISDGETISVTNPHFYAQRFQDFFQSTVFRKIPSSTRSPSKKKVLRQKSLQDSNEMRTHVDMSHRRPDILADHVTPGPSSSRSDRAFREGTNHAVTSGGILVHRPPPPSDPDLSSAALTQKRVEPAETDPNDDGEGPPPYSSIPADKETERVGQVSDDDKELGQRVAALTVPEPTMSSDTGSGSEYEEDETRLRNRGEADEPHEELSAQAAAGVSMTKKSVRFTSESAGALAAVATVPTRGGKGVSSSQSEGTTPGAAGADLSQQTQGQRAGDLGLEVTRADEKRGPLEDGESMPVEVDNNGTAVTSAGEGERLSDEVKKVYTAEQDVELSAEVEGGSLSTEKTYL